MFKRLKFLTPFAVVLMFLVVYSNPMGRALLKSVVNIFAFGKSDFKIFFFIGFYFLTSLVWPLLPKQISRKFCIFVFWAVVACFALQFLEFFWLQIKMSAPLLSEEYLFLVDGSALTSTKITHIHSAKIIIAVVVQSFEFLRNANIRADYGLPLLSYHGKLLAVTHLALVLVTCGAVFYSLRHFKNHLPRAWFIFYFLSIFTLLKNSVDGGLFNRECMIMLPIFLVVFHKSLRKTSASFLQLSVYYYIACLIIILPFRIIQLHDELLRENVHFLIVVCLFTFIYAVVEPQVKRRSLLLVGSAALLAVIYCSPVNFFTPMAYGTFVKENTWIQFTNKDGELNLAGDYELIKKDRAGEYTLYTVVNKKIKSSHQIYVDLSKYIDYERLSIDGLNWNRMKPPVMTGILVISDIGSFKMQDYFSNDIFKMRLKKIAGNRYFFYIRANVGNQQFNPMFAYYLHGLGLSRFTFISNTY